MYNNEFEGRTERLSARLSRLESAIVPTNYLDKLLSQFVTDLKVFFTAEQVITVDKLRLVIEHDYKRQGLVGRGYHCLEHSVELAALILKACIDRPASFPALSESLLMEMVVAALLHDYDPHNSGGAPRVERTLHAIQTDDIIQDLLGRLHVNTRDVALFIQRTDYPFTGDKDALWQTKLLFRFHDEQERKKFIAAAEMLALLDKASPYYMLAPEQAQKRVEDLAEEIQCPKDKILALTPSFFEAENIAGASYYLPVRLHKNWMKVKSHFHKFAENGQRGAI